MYLTDEVYQEHDEAVCQQIAKGWDVTLIAFFAGQQFKLSKAAAEDLVNPDPPLAHPIVTGSLEHKIALIRFFVKEKVKVPGPNGFELITVQNFKVWLKTMERITQ